MPSYYGKGPYGEALYSLAPIVDLAGNLAPSIILSASPSVLRGVAGNLTPAVSFAASLSLSTSLAGGLIPSVVFAGRLGIIQSVAGGLTPAVALAGDLTVTPATELAGDMSVLVTFGPSLLTTPQTIFGDLAPLVNFTADMSVIYAVTGDIAPQIGLGASLGGDWLLSGDMSLEVDLAAELTSGPLWDAPDGCPVQEWEESELCSPPLWTPTVPPSWAPSGSQDALGYGMGGYGIGKYNQFETPWEPSDSVPPATWASSPPAIDVEWDETELCDG